MMTILKSMVFSLISLCALVFTTNVGVCSDIEMNGQAYQRVGNQVVAPDDQDVEALMRQGETFTHSTILRQLQYKFRPYAPIVIGAGGCIFAYSMYNQFCYLDDIQNQIDSHEDWNDRCVTIPCNGITYANVAGANDMDRMVNACLNSDSCFYNIQDLFNGCYIQECIDLRNRMHSDDTGYFGYATAGAFMAFCSYILAYNKA